MKTFLASLLIIFSSITFAQEEPKLREVPLTQEEKIVVSSYHCTNVLGGTMFQYEGVGDKPHCQTAFAVIVYFEADKLRECLGTAIFYSQYYKKMGACTLIFKLNSEMAIVDDLEPIFTKHDVLLMGVSLYKNKQEILVVPAQ